MFIHIVFYFEHVFMDVLDSGIFIHILDVITLMHILDAVIFMHIYIY